MYQLLNMRGFQSTTMIAPVSGIPILHIVSTFPCSELVEFYDIVMYDNFDVVHGIQMLTMNFYGPWRIFVILEPMCDC